MFNTSQTCLWGLCSLTGENFKNVFSWFSLITGETQEDVNWSLTEPGSSSVRDHQKCSPPSLEAVLVDPAVTESCSRHSFDPIPCDPSIDPGSYLHLRR